MKSLVSTIKNKHGKLKKSGVLPLLIMVFLFPLSLQAEDTQQGNTTSSTINEVLSDAINDKTTPDAKITPPKVNAAFIGEKTENKSTEETEEKPKQKNLIDIKFVKVPEDQRPEVKIKFSKNYKKTDLSQQPEDTYQRTVIKRVKTGLTDEEVIASVEEACAKYHADMKKNYHIYIVDEETEKAIGNYSCEGL